MRNLVKWLRNEESGQGMVEYAFIIVLVSVAAIAALMLIGPAVSNIFNNATNNLTN